MMTRSKRSRWLRNQATQSKFIIIGIDSTSEIIKMLSVDAAAMLACTSKQLMRLCCAVRYSCYEFGVPHVNGRPIRRLAISGHYIYAFYRRLCRMVRIRTSESSFTQRTSPIMRTIIMAHQTRRPVITDNQGGSGKYIAYKTFDGKIIRCVQRNVVLLNMKDTTYTYKYRLVAVAQMNDDGVLQITWI